MLLKRTLVTSDSAKGTFFSARRLKELVKRARQREWKQREKKKGKEEKGKGKKFPLPLAWQQRFPAGKACQARPVRKRKQTGQATSIVEAGDWQGVSTSILSPLKPLVPGGWNRIIASPCTQKRNHRKATVFCVFKFCCPSIRTVLYVLSH